MTTPNFHARTMNIPTPPAYVGPNGLVTDGARTAYTLGHRDARHAAAEIASEADAQICALRKALDNAASVGNIHAARCDQALEEVTRLRQRAAEIFEVLRIEPSRAPVEALSLAGLIECLYGWASHRAGERLTDDDRQRFAMAMESARMWLWQHDGGEWRGWSCAVLTGTQELSSPGWYALPPGQWCGEPHILIERAERDGMELPTVAEAVDAWGVPVKVEE